MACLLPLLCNPKTASAGCENQSLETRGQDLESGSMPPQHRRPSRSHRTQAPTKSQAREVSPAKTERTRRVRVQPYGGSYFLPGKVASKAVIFLLNSGCTTNLLSCQLFDTLSAKDKAGLELYQGKHGTLADGSCIPFYSIVELTGRVRDQAI